MYEFGKWMTGRERNWEFPLRYLQTCTLTVKQLESAVGREKADAKAPALQPGQFLSEERVNLVTPKGRDSKMWQSWDRSAPMCRWNFSNGC